jgi:hypothetical protein
VGLPDWRMLQRLLQWVPADERLPDFIWAPFGLIVGGDLLRG